MKRKSYVYIVLGLLILGLFSSCISVHASEINKSEQITDTLETKESEVQAEERIAAKKGWNTFDGHRFYYLNKTKMVTGWRLLNRKYYFFRKNDTDEGPKGSMVTGFMTRKGKTFYFAKDGTLQTGWKRINKKIYYFAQKGGKDYIGAMYTGLHKIGSYRYLFDETGIILTGFREVNGKTYYFSADKGLGVRGRSVTGWKTIDGISYYFNKNGVLQKNKWIDQKYYVDGEGHLLKSTITPDGYVVNASGVKGKLASGWKKLDGSRYYYDAGKKLTGWQVISGNTYYLGEDGARRNGFITMDGSRYYLKKGIMQTGWITISGSRYYFDSDGKMAVNTVINGISIGVDGVADLSSKVPSVLIIAGHGMGDVGAKGEYGSVTYYEYEYTRQFANLIKAKIDASGAKISVAMYDQNYDLYQIHAEKKTGPVPDLTAYDYVLEVHFNATIESLKDSKGDDQFKGVGMYINSARTGVQLDKAIVKAIASTGFKIWGGGTGIFKSATLLNARLCQEKEVPYGLLETAFIDDKDDMTFYNQNKVKMAQAAADAIVKYFNELY